MYHIIEYINDFKLLYTCIHVLHCFCLYIDSRYYYYKHFYYCIVITTIVIIIAVLLLLLLRFLLFILYMYVYSQRILCNYAYVKYNV